MPIEFLTMTYDQIIKHFGSQAAAARSLGVSQPSVWGWKDGIPIERQIDIEIKTEGKLKADLPNSIRRQSVTT